MTLNVTPGVRGSYREIQIKKQEMIMTRTLAVLGDKVFLGTLPAPSPEVPLGPFQDAFFAQCRLVICLCRLEA